jgi:hypothetical protein
MEHNDERQPDTGTAAMSKEDPERTRLGAHLEDTDADATDRPVEVEEARPGDRASLADEPDRASAAVWSGEPGGTVPETYADEEDRLDRPRDED